MHGYAKPARTEDALIFARHFRCFLACAFVAWHAILSTMHWFGMAFTSACSPLLHPLHSPAPKAPLSLATTMRSRTKLRATRLCREPPPTTQNGDTTPRRCLFLGIKVHLPGSRHLRSSGPSMALVERDSSELPSGGQNR